MVYFWVLFFIVSCIGAKISLLSNAHGGKWFAIACVLSAIPWFPVMSLKTKNIFVDSLIYDVLILIAYVGVYIFEGAGKTLVTSQWIGVGFTILGILMMKIKF